MLPLFTLLHSQLIINLSIVTSCVKENSEWLLPCATATDSYHAVSSQEMGSVISDICDLVCVFVFVCIQKGKWLELLTPNLVDMAVARHALS